MTKTTMGGADPDTRKRRRIGDGIRTMIVVPAILMLSTACQPGRTGSLEPDDGLRQGPRSRYDGPSAMVSAHGMSAAVSGMWTTRLGANSMDVQVAYKNEGDKPATLILGRFATYRGADRAYVMEASDVTGMNLADDRTDNDDARQLLSVYEKKEAGTVDLAPGESMIIEASLSMADGVADLDTDQKVIVQIPLPGAIAKVPFHSTD